MSKLLGSSGAWRMPATVYKHKKKWFVLQKHRFPTFGGQKLTLFGLVWPLNSMWVFFRSIKKLQFGMTKSFNFFDKTQNGTKNYPKCMHGKQQQWFGFNYHFNMQQTLNTMFRFVACWSDSWIQIIVVVFLYIHFGQVLLSHLGFCQKQVEALSHTKL